jgi:hypothetical protein
MPTEAAGLGAGAAAAGSEGFRLRPERRGRFSGQLGRFREALLCRIIVGPLAGQAVKVAANAELDRGPLERVRERSLEPVAAVGLFGRAAHVGLDDPLTADAAAQLADHAAVR